VAFVFTLRGVCRFSLFFSLELIEIVIGLSCYDEPLQQFGKFGAKYHPLVRCTPME